MKNYLIVYVFVGLTILKADDAEILSIRKLVEDELRNEFRDHSTLTLREEYDLLEESGYMGRYLIRGWDQIEIPMAGENFILHHRMYPDESTASRAADAVVHLMSTFQEVSDSDFGDTEYRIGWSFMIVRKGSFLFAIRMEGSSSARFRDESLKSKFGEVRLLLAREVSDTLDQGYSN